MNRSILLVFLLALTLLAGCAPAATTRPDLLQNVVLAPGEAIGTDILAVSVPSSDLSVAGVKIGMTQSQVLAILGESDKIDEYQFGAIQNWHYGKMLGLTATGIIVHFENGFATRITIFEPLNQYLVGNTKTGLTRSDVYTKFGTPERQYDIKGGRYFVYNARGLEVYFQNDRVNAYGLVLANRKLPSTATLAGLTRDPFIPRTPKLVTDTTSQCDDGPTQAFSPGTGECMAYGNYCMIPDSWIEVKSCEAEDVTLEALLAALRSQQ